VIGYKGVVGGATYRLFKHLGYDVIGADKGDCIELSDVYFICVPEWAVADVMPWIPQSGLVVIRSSVPPLTTERLAKQYLRHICHNPEFLHQAVADIDAHNPDSVVIGECCDFHGAILEALYKPLCCPIVRTQPRISETVKLARNNYGATVISFWNEIETICRAAGINAYHVGMIASFDPIITAKGSRFHGRYGGACLPKDMKQMIRFAHSLNIEPKLLNAVESVNDEVCNDT